MLNDLGGALQARFVRTGSAAELNEAVAALRQSVPATGPENHDYGGYLHNLAGVLFTRYQRTWSTPDPDEAISVCQRAIAAAASRVNYPTVLAYLSMALALRTRSHQTGSARDLGKAIDLGRTAQAQASADFPGRAMIIINLSDALQLRGVLKGSEADLAESRRFAGPRASE